MRGSRASVMEGVLLGLMIRMEMGGGVGVAGGVMAVSWYGTVLDLAGGGVCLVEGELIGNGQWGVEVDVVHHGKTIEQQVSTEPTGAWRRSR